MTSCEVYDIKKNKWIEVTDMNEGRSMHSGVVLGGVVYVFGG